MIIDPIKRINTKVRLKSLSCWITSHLGKKPRNGGIPPKDKTENISENAIIVLIEEIEFKDEIEEDEK